MARQGHAGEALAISGLASFVGAFAATIGLVVLAPQLVEVALLFGPAEYFAMFTLAFATLGGVTSANQAKAGFATCLGLSLAFIGVDGQTGVPRFTFGNVHFYDGIDFLVAIVGMFALSEVFVFIEERGKVGSHTTAKMPDVGRVIPPWSMVKETSGAMGRGTVLGFIAGVLPGAGASLGSFLAYTIEKKVAGKNGRFGKGDPRGVAAPEAGNNAAAGGALVPMLALGVPGSGTTAVLLAMLLAMDITPGPLLFTQNPDVVWGLIAALFIGNIMLLALNLPMVGMFTKILKIPSMYLMPGVTMVSFVGIYGITNSTFDLMLMIGFGVLGWVLRKFEIPMVPVILGILLGELMEKNLRRALTISDGDFAVLYGSPLAVGFLAVAVVGFIVPIFLRNFVKPKKLVEDAITEGTPD
jgi:putative tricarboxylic transport membrane protein